MNIALTKSWENLHRSENHSGDLIPDQYRKYILLPRIIFGILVAIYPLTALVFEFTRGAAVTEIILGYFTSIFLLAHGQIRKHFIFKSVGLAFFAGSSIDLLNLITTAPKIHQLVGISTPYVMMQVSGAYLVSPVIIGLILITSPLIYRTEYLRNWFFSGRRRLNWCLVLTILTVLLVFWLLPFQKYFNPKGIFYRPMDLLPTFLFLLALGIWFWYHFRQPSILSSWIVISLGLFLFSHFMLSMSSVRLDFYYQLSRGYEQLALLAPTCGVIIYYFVELDLMEKKLSHLKSQQNASAAANLAKSEFITHMSHEIRTPINGIIGLTQLVMETPPSFQQRQYLQMLRNSACQLLSPLGEILDLARIEAGQLELEQKNFSLRELVENVSDAVVYKADEKGLELTMLVQHDVPDKLEGDPRRFKQVLLNLLDNAVKFSDHGTIAVKIYQTEKGRSKLRLHVTVTDQGIGIAPEFHEVIFDRFNQVNTKIFQKYGGTGLGLTLARQIVTEMGGEIWVESEPGEGSVFHFTAILGLQKNIENPLVERDMRQAEVLVIEANRPSRESLKEMLHTFECQVFEAVDKTEAFELLSRTDAIKLVICDYQMSQPVAIRFVNRVRRFKAYHRLPIIFLVSIVGDQDTSDLESLPSLWFIPKPVKQSRLFNVIMEAMNTEHPNKTTIRNVPFSESLTFKNLKTPVRILLVEDNQINQTVARGLLNKTGIFIDVVENGQRALEILKKKQFDIILMDIQMPQMDGLEASQKIRKELNLTEIPIIAITAHALKGDREKCLAAGMNDYISKPVRPEQLYLIINKWIGKKNLVLPAS